MQYYKSLLTNNNLLYLSGASWSIIGFNRGLHEYDYEHSEDNDNYHKKQPYMYTNKIFNGLFGIFIYINPCFIPLIIHKELYRLEINVRGLENEKTSREYNKIL